MHNLNIMCQCVLQNELLVIIESIEKYLPRFTEHDYIKPSVDKLNGFIKQ